MPMYDYRCDACGREALDCYRKISETTEPCSNVECEGTMQRVWMQQANSVVGDEIDVWMKNALCYADGSPRHFRSRQELARVAAEKGYTNRVDHIGAQGSDRNKHTQRWI